jgi:hypothetical protein
MVTLISRIKLADFSTISESDKERRITQIVGDFVSPSPELLKEQKANLAQRIQGFETQYKMSSQNMKQAIRSGSMVESADFCTWLMLLEIRDRLEASV